MLNCKFAINEKRALKILCLGAHSDDIEIGCGGTILRILSEYDDVEVHWVVLGSTGERDHEARESAHRFLKDATRKEIIIEHFRDGFFPYVGGEVKDFVEQLKKIVVPDVIFTHCRHDLHQDHRLVCDLTWNTFRGHLILEYEILKYDGDLGNPNFFVHLDERSCQMKVGNIIETFKSQMHHHWFTEEAFFAMLRLRGIESKAPEGFAEGFYCRKVVF